MLFGCIAITKYSTRSVDRKGGVDVARMYHMAVIALRVLACPERSGGWEGWPIRNGSSARRAIILVAAYSSRPRRVHDG